MAANLDLLIPKFKTKVLTLVERCRTLGYEMRPNAGLRDCKEQARLWRQSRSTEEINEAVASLKRDGAAYLAKCLVDVGPQHGRHVTNALPGYSWHQWGEALDAFWLLDGAAEWSTTKKVNGRNAYHVWAEEASKLGLDAGGLWPRFKDWPHVQLSKDSGPSVTKSAAEIDAAMKQRFG